MRMSSGTLLVSGLLVSGLLLSASPFAHEVEVSNYQFKPAELHIRAGETVTWVNREKRVSHSVIFLGSGTESERFFPDERWSRKFDAPGRYPYTCGPHPEMLGVIVVTD
ncbi:MAG: plastocyanin/azurin family copper-binding protein [Azoarcus sp.]|nr:plastocyanin/azurin family copper-binding protein [Azoarcus sp.]